ncbi:MAG: heme-dependent oxidative N-demethylase family protein [Shimia sp.]
MGDVDFGVRDGRARQDVSQTAPILQDAIPYDVTPRALPGIRPLNPAEWLIRDEAFAAQVALKRRLLAGRRDAVLREEPGSQDAQAELLDEVLRHLREDHGIDETPRATHPLEALAEVAQEDFSIQEKVGDEHVMTAGMIAFPAFWRLADKIGRPLTAIHGPVPEYEGVAARVQRLFDGVQVGRPLWRYNRLVYADPALHQPAPMDGTDRDRTGGTYLRSERQVMWRLPKTRAVVFSIHTYVVEAASVLTA